MSEGRAIAEACRKAGVVLALGYQRRRESHFRYVKKQIDSGAFGKLVNAEANISRDRLGKIDLVSWRYQAQGMPGGVMLQIGIHYSDVLEYLMGPIVAVSGRLAQLVLPGDNPDVASLRARAPERRDLHAQCQLRLGVRILPAQRLRQGSQRLLRHAQRPALLKRGSDKATHVPCDKNDVFVEELEEFAAAVRGGAKPEMDGDSGTTSLAVLRAGILSAKEGRRVEVAEVLKND